MSIAFRTVSDAAALVLARKIPLDKLADEMRRIYFSPGQIADIRTKEWRTMCKR